MSAQNPLLGLAKSLGPSLLPALLRSIPGMPEIPGLTKEGTEHLSTLIDEYGPVVLDKLGRLKGGAPELPPSTNLPNGYALVSLMKGWRDVQPSDCYEALQELLFADPLGADGLLDESRARFAMTLADVLIPILHRQVSARIAANAPPPPKE